MRRCCWGALSLVLAGCFVDEPTETGDERDSEDTSESAASTDSTAGETGSQTSESTTTSSGTTAQTSAGTSTSTTADDGTSTTEATDTTGTAGDDETTDGSTTDPAAQCPLILDDFEDGVIAPQWILTEGAFVSEADGELSLEITPQIGDFVSARRDGLDLTDAIVTVELGATPEVEAAQLLLNAFSPQNHRLIIIVQQAGLSVREGVPGESALNLLDTAAFDPKTMRWIRFVFNEDVVYFETSMDEESWDPLFEAPYDWDASNASFGLSASNFKSLAQPQTVSLRSFEVCVGT